MPHFAPRSADAERNKGPTLEVRRGILPARGTALTIASGTVQRAAHIAAAFAGLTRLAPDSDPAGRAVITARLAAARLPIVLALGAHTEP
jgi:hypothetical protein